MLDLRWLRENSEKAKELLERRGQPVNLPEIVRLDEDRRRIIQEMENLRSERKRQSAVIGQKRQDGEELAELTREAESLREKIKELEALLADLEVQIRNLLLLLPNLPDENVPSGQSAQDNRVVRQQGNVRQFSFTPRPHWVVGELLNILDFPRAAKLSGSRFALLKGWGVALERALINFMLDLHIRKHKYQEIFTPFLVNRQTMEGTGQLPKFEVELFRCRDDELYLIPTAEVTLTNLHRDEILTEEDLPRRYVAYSACFRREAGSYGKDTRGLIRNHQFNKVELVKITRPEDSAEELERLVQEAEEVLRQLGLPYRVVELCTGDLGFASARTYDLEVWMPGENCWREISSCSNCKDFQARRMNLRFRRKNEKKELAHTLNGSGVAVGRTWAAILENYQEADGTVRVPPVLVPYLGTEIIERR